MQIKIGDKFIRDGKKMKVIDIRYTKYYDRICLIMDCDVGANPYIPLECLIYDELLEAKIKHKGKKAIYLNPIDKKIKKLLKIK